MGRLIDLTGQRFGKLVVLRRATEEERAGRAEIHWVCKCDCGNIKITGGQGLRQGKTTSCGCDRQEKLKKLGDKRRINEVGNRYGKLVVLELDEQKSFELDKNKRKRTWWRCQCDCGNIVSISRDSLINGGTQSCGCIQKEIAAKHMSKMSSSKYIDEIGNKYGKLTVIEKLDKSGTDGVRWLCKCDCGNFIEAAGGKLRSGHVNSCGCIGKSKGEYAIEQLLEQYHINYCREYKIYCGNTGSPHRFDFAVFNNNQLQYLIEYDGIQHTQASDFFGGEEHLAYVQAQDNIKNMWCKENCIPLIRIPYTHYNKLCIEDLKLETTAFLL